jgi:hypothetical protein
LADETTYYGFSINNPGTFGTDHGKDCTGKIISMDYVFPDYKEKPMFSQISNVIPGSINGYRLSHIFDEYPVLDNNDIDGWRVLELFRDGFSNVDSCGPTGYTRVLRYWSSEGVSEVLLNYVSDFFLYHEFGVSNLEEVDHWGYRTSGEHIPTIKYPRKWPLDWVYVRRNQGGL